jgi:hypothetical protein
VEVGGSDADAEGAANAGGLTEEEQLAIAMQESLAEVNGVGTAPDAAEGGAAEPIAAAGGGRGKRSAAAGLTATVTAAGGRGGRVKGRGRNAAAAAQVCVSRSPVMADTALTLRATHLHCHGQIRQG